MSKGPGTLAELVRDRAESEGDRVAYIFLPDDATAPQQITWAELHRRASALATRLLESGAQQKPVLLLLPSGLAFVESLFACWYAGAIAVPACLPRHRRLKHRLDLLLADVGAKLAIGSDEIRARLNEDANGSPVANLQWIEGGSDSSPDIEPRASAQNLAVLQYTSGSTGAPRGVMITHDNLICNSGQIAEACGHDAQSTVGGWVPLFHDMGLVGLLQAAFTGARCVFMSPERFLMRPWLWLQMISAYRVGTSPAPNFAYDLCVERISEEQKKNLDLSCWRNALSGAEPVRGRTLDRFAHAFASCGFNHSAFFPCYGLAEATLFVAGPGKDRQISRRNTDGSLVDGPDPHGHVSCGRTFGDSKIAIVDPQTRRKLPEQSIGEIWINSESCAKGYWNRPEETAATFQAHLDTSNAEEARLCWLRTGDLGLMAGGELFITGRLRELIIIAGRNLYPIDLEQAAEASDPAIAPLGAAAFSVDLDGTERLIIVAEVRRECARAARGGAQPFDPAATKRRLRAAIAAAHDVTPFDVQLLAPGALPRTSSGKIMRHAVRKAYLEKSLELLGAGRAHAAV